MRDLWLGIIAKRNDLAVYNNRREPKAGLFVKPDALELRAAIRPHTSIGLVLLACGTSKVRNTVIAPVPIDVINLIHRAVTIHPNPCQPMGIMQFVLDTDQNIAVSLIEASRDLASAVPVPTKKNPREWVIIKLVSDLALRNHTAPIRPTLL